MAYGSRFSGDVEKSLTKGHVVFDPADRPTHRRRGLSPIHQAQASAQNVLGPTMPSAIRPCVL